MNELRVRAADPTSARDARAIAEIYAESLAIGDASLDEEPWSATGVLQRQAGFDEREGFLLLEELGPDLGEATTGIHGWALLKCYSERAGYRFTCESAIYVRRGLVRLGLGTRLGEALLERCRAADYHHVVAKVLAANAGSIAFHERLGFELVGRQREVGWRDGCWCDVAILQCLLETAGD